MKIYKYTYASPIGPLLIESNEKHLIGLTLKESDEKDTSLIIRETIKWLDRYFKGEKTNIRNFRFNFEGTEFQKDVWSELIKIPYGESTTYGNIAKTLAEKYGIEKMSAQAVGQAVSKNPIAIIVPCHRVLGSNLKLNGYAYGIEVKSKLLDIERINYKRVS